MWLLCGYPAGAYELNAVIGSFDLLRSQTAGIRETAAAPLRQRTGLVPVTTQLLEELTGLTDQDGAGPGQPFTVTSPAFEQTLSYWSRGGPIAYVEADFHGGAGYQAAAVWRTGAKVWGPAHTWDFTGPREDWPINAALALPDVVPSSSERASYHDLFLEVGLGWEQDMDGWQFGRPDCSMGGDLRRVASGAPGGAGENSACRRGDREIYRRLPDVPVALDGKAIMELFDLSPGSLIGAATRYLQDLHLEHGPLSREEAVTRLRTWAAEQDTGCRGR